MRSSHIEIDTSALAHNLQRARTLSGKGKTYCVIKNNAYGHGIQEIARSLSAADGFIVALVEEALLIKQSLERSPDVVVLQGFHDKEDLHAIHNYRLICVIHSLSQVDLLLKSPLPIRIWLKINTGMNRLGLAPECLLSVLKRLAGTGMEPEVIMTHLAAAGQTDKSFTLRQIEMFYKTTYGLKYLHSLANSPALLSVPDARADFNRIGLMLYGASPLDGTSASSLDLKPVMTLKSKLISVYRIKQHDTVGYDRTWSAPSERLIGIVSVGYGDGYPRMTQANEAPVLVNGKLCHLAGRVSMDSLGIDLGPYDQVQGKYRVGDSVVLWGKGLPVETIAQASNRSPYDILGQLPLRLARKYID